MLAGSFVLSLSGSRPARAARVAKRETRVVAVAPIATDVPRTVASGTALGGSLALATGARNLNDVLDLAERAGIGACEIASVDADRCVVLVGGCRGCREKAPSCDFESAFLEGAVASFAQGARARETVCDRARGRCAFELLLPTPAAAGVGPTWA